MKWVVFWLKHGLLHALFLLSGRIDQTSANLTELLSFLYFFFLHLEVVNYLFELTPFTTLILQGSLKVH